MILERPLSKEAKAGNHGPVRSFSFHNTKVSLLISDRCRFPPAMCLRIPLPTPRQCGLPPQAPLRKERYRSARQSTACRCTRDGVQYEVGSTSTGIVSDQLLKYRLGSWSLDPMVPQVPAQDLVQMVLEGRGEKKWRCGYRCSKKKVPPTAMLCSRHSSIHATLRVVGESALRSVATIRSKSRGGNIFLDVVSLGFSFSSRVVGLILSQTSIAPMRTVHVDAHSRRGALVLYFLTRGSIDASS